MRLCSYITGVEDYKTMLEMAQRGDRYKLDLGFPDLFFKKEILELYQMQFTNYPVTFMTKLRRDKVESGEITHEDICASVFSCAAMIIEKQLYQLASLFQHKNAYVGGSLV